MCCLSGGGERETVETIPRVFRLKSTWLMPGVNEIPPWLTHYNLFLRPVAVGLFLQGGFAVQDG